MTSWRTNVLGHSKDQGAFQGPSMAWQTGLRRETGSTPPVRSGVEPLGVGRVRVECIYQGHLGEVRKIWCFQLPTCAVNSKNGNLRNLTSFSAASSSSCKPFFMAHGIHAEKPILWFWGRISVSFAASISWYWETWQTRSPGDPLSQIYSEGVFASCSSQENFQVCPHSTKFSKDIPLGRIN